MLDWTLLLSAAALLCSLAAAVLDWAGCPTVAAAGSVVTAAVLAVAAVLFAAVVVRTYRSGG